MAKQGMPRGGPPNMQQLMKQAQRMQQQLAEAQAKLAESQVEGAAGNGLVTATVSGGGELIGLVVKPEIVDPDDVDTLVDLVVYAIQDAQKKAAELQNATMVPLAGGAGGLPGLSF
jgi:DNA-binding YbaB/EbfC family protein